MRALRSRRPVTPQADDFIIIIHTQPYEEPPRHAAEKVVLEQTPASPPEDKKATCRLGRWALISTCTMRRLRRKAIGCAAAKRHCFETLAGSGDAPGRVSGATAPLPNSNSSSFSIIDPTFSVLWGGRDGKKWKHWGPPPVESSHNAMILMRSKMTLLLRFAPKSHSVRLPSTAQSRLVAVGRDEKLQLSPAPALLVQKFHTRNFCCRLVHSSFLFLPAGLYLYFGALEIANSDRPLAISLPRTSGH